MTINSITSKEIYLKFEAKKKDIVQTHLKCSAFLQEKRFNRTQVHKCATDFYELIHVYVDVSNEPSSNRFQSIDSINQI
jgi:hypothetical protein